MKLSISPLSCASFSIIKFITENEEIMCSAQLLNAGAPLHLKCERENSRTNDVANWIHASKACIFIPLPSILFPRRSGS